MSLNRPDKRSDNSHGIRSDSLGDSDEFHDIEAALATLILRNERLWALEARGQFLLGQARLVCTELNANVLVMKSAEQGM